MKFLRVSGEKTGDFFPAGPFFIMLSVNVYLSALIPRKLPCPKKIPGYAAETNANISIW